DPSAPAPPELPKPTTPGG
ncbi:membrane protein, partial [Mycobacterium montefiorense]